MSVDTVVATVLAALSTALGDTDAGVPARVCEVPGDVAWDECECGLLAVSAGRTYPSTRFPLEATPEDLARNCASPYDATELTVTLLRCAPSPTDFGRAPSCTELDAAALTWMHDMEVLRPALACALGGLQDTGVVEVWTMWQTLPAGPQGACVGSTTRVTVGLFGCLCPTPTT